MSSYKRKKNEAIIRLEKWKVKTLLHYYFVSTLAWVVIIVSSRFFSGAKQQTMTHKTPLITASGHKGWDLRHPLITASRRMALDWLSFSLEGKCMDRVRMLNYIEVSLLLEVLCQEMVMENNCESRWFWHRIKYILLFHDRIIGCQRDWFQINFLLNHHGTVWQNGHRVSLSENRFDFCLWRRVCWPRHRYSSPIVHYSCYCVKRLFLDSSSQVPKHSEGQDR